MSDTNITTTLTSVSEAPVSSSTPFPIWGYVLIAAGVLGVLGIIIFAATRQKNSKKKAKKIAEYKTKEDKRFAAIAAELGEHYTPTDHAAIERQSRYYTAKGGKPIKRTG